MSRLNPNHYPSEANLIDLLLLTFTIQRTVTYVRFPSFCSISLLCTTRIQQSSIFVSSSINFVLILCLFLRYFSHKLIPVLVLLSSFAPMINSQWRCLTPNSWELLLYCQNLPFIFLFFSFRPFRQPQTTNTCTILYGMCQYCTVLYVPIRKKPQDRFVLYTVDPFCPLPYTVNTVQYDQCGLQEWKMRHLCSKTISIIWPYMCTRTVSILSSL